MRPLGERVISEYHDIYITVFNLSDICLTQTSARHAQTCGSAGHITPHCMGKHDSGPNRPSPATYVTQDGSKIWLFLGQNQAFMAGPGSKGVHITWKVSGVLVQIHGKTCLRTIHHLLMHPFGADGSKIWLFLCGLCYRRLLISRTDVKTLS